MTAQGRFLLRRISVPQNAYMPTGRIGAPQFIQAHPTYDGRGVKVGIVDSGVDLDRPELQSALDLAGHPVRKMYDWTTTAPAHRSGAGDPTWVEMEPVTLNPEGDNFTSSVGKYQVPQALKATTTTSSAFSTRTTRVSAVSSGTTSIATGTRRTSSASSRTTPALSRSTPTRTRTSSVSRR